MLDSPMLSTTLLLPLPWGESPSIPQSTMMQHQLHRRCRCRYKQSTGGVAVNPTIKDDNRRSKYNNRRIPLKKKYSHCFFFVAVVAFGNLLDLVMLLPFLWGGVSLHYQKDPKILCHHGSRSKTSKDPKIQKYS